MQHAARTHSELGASVCKRWWNCPGSVALSRGFPNVESEHAREGTAAHELAELCLRNGQGAAEYVDRTVAGRIVGAEMADAVQIYVDHVRSLPGELQIEVGFTLESISPPAPMFGTADAVAYDSETQHLYVSDLKYGKGVVVAAEGNPQLRYYALGAVLSLGDGKPVRAVTSTIVQPRAGGSPVRSVTIDALDLAEWSLELIDRARAAVTPDASLSPGEWCRFCPASGVCSAQARAATAVAQVEFGAGSPPEIRLLTPEQISAVLSQATQLEQWLKDLRTAATNAISRGDVIPGWKLAAKEGRDAWRDENEAAASLTCEGLADGEIYERSLRSPAQIRERVAARLIEDAATGGKKLTKKDATVAARTSLAPLLHRPTSGAVLVPDADPRPALPTGGSEFNVLESET